MAHAHKRDGETGGGHPHDSRDVLQQAAAAPASELFQDAAEMRRTITETSPDYIIVLAPDLTIQYINRVLDEFEGVNVIGRPALEFILPEEREATAACFRRVLETGKTDRYETTYDSPEAGRVSFECRVAPIYRAGRIVGLTVLARDVTQQKNTEQALREALQNHRALIDQSPVGIVSIGGDGRIISANPAYHRMLGYADRELDGKAVLELTHPDDRAATEALFQEFASGTCEQRMLEKRYRHRDGEYVWTRVSASTICDEGRFVRGVAVVQDISGQKQAEHRQRMLMRELDHRVRNNLAAILSLAQQTVASSASLADFEGTFISRVAAMTRSHEALAQSQWSDIDVGAALAAVLATHLDEVPPRIQLSGPPIKLDARTAMPLCLAMHELAANAASHGALSSINGRVNLAWTKNGTALRLQWRESGGPPVEPPREPGLGTELIEGFVRFELRGTLDIRFDPAGLECDVTIPLPASDE